MEFGAWLNMNRRTGSAGPLYSLGTTIGIILCSQKNEAIVKYSVLNDGKQIFASKYKLELPTAEELQKELEAERKRIEDKTEPKNLQK